MKSHDTTRDVEPENDYAWSAGLYDFVLEPFVRHIRARFAAWMAAENIERALDIGCGTGKQIALAPEGTESVGIDLSRPMLRQAGRQVPGRCIHGDATRLPFGDSDFDLVYTQFALHEKEPDTIAQLLVEAERVLAPDGRLAVVDYTAPPHETWWARVGHLGISAIERLAGGEHFANYRTWLGAGGIDQVLANAGWREQEAHPFFGGAVKLAVYRRG